VIPEGFGYGVVRWRHCGGALWRCSGRETERERDRGDEKKGGSTGFFGRGTELERLEILGLIKKLLYG